MTPACCWFALTLAARFGVGRVVNRNRFLYRRPR